MIDPLLQSSDLSVCLTDLESKSGKSKSGPIVSVRSLGEVDVPQQDEDDF